MSKFISVGDSGDFAKITNYISEKKGNTNYYIAPKLMYNILMTPNIHSALGVHLDDIKFWAQDQYDLVVFNVYNKRFENIAFKIEAIKLYGVTLIRPAFGFENDTVIFGMNEEAEDYNCCKLETI